MSTPEPWLEGQVVLILVGLVGSGKSTFATQLQQHYPQFLRCNQDDLGDRREVERLARSSLAKGLSVCIDRTNFNAAQRSHWIQIAQEFPDTSIWVIVFDTPYEVCAERLRARTGHPTIKDAEQGLYVLSRFAADFEHPMIQEGMDRMISLKPEDTPLVYTSSDIASILRRVHASPPVSGFSSPRSSYGSQSFQGWQSSRGNSRRGHFSRGYPSTSYQNPYRGRGLAYTASLNNRSTWRDSTGRGAGYAVPGTGHFRSSNPRVEIPLSNTTENTVFVDAASEHVGEVWRF